MVLFGYLIAVSTPGASMGLVRVFAYLLGLSFLCWPNIAYHLDKSLRRWPSTQGFVISGEATEHGWNVGYNYFFNGVRYGGIARVQPVVGSTVHDSYPDGKPLLVSYDPYNPDCSQVL